MITKSITRFARNTVVLLETVRELKKHGIDCYFEKENMHSISPDGELLLTLLAMYAEEEARSASENQKWRIKKKFEKGEPWVGRMLGYRLGDGRLEVVPEEAKLVQYIFTSYLSGMSMTAIAKELNASSIPATVSDVWNRTSIHTILTNEKYTGNMVLQKTYRPDFRTKKGKINRGQVAKYEVANSHEAIISQADFNAVQQRLQQNCGAIHSAKNDGANLFAGLMKCGQCSGSYMRRNANTGKYKHPVWTCRRSNELTKAACPAQAIPETILIEKTKEVLGLGADTALGRELLLSKIQKIVVPEPHQLIYYMRDGTITTVPWQHKSRRESWTPEMRETARQRALAQNQESPVV